MKELLLTAKAFADPTRVRVLAALRKGELCVCELCDALAVSQSTLSTHLQVIRDAGLVSTRKEGKWKYYVITRAASSLVGTLFRLFATSVTQDAALLRDRKRLTRRLSLRNNGTCCIGFEPTRRGTKGPGH